ncbi:MAG: glutamate--tRNA ligase [Flavobacteriaceae bacterium]|nr:glutamate--tRNA ligase [Flavobacteriaceae bacterium]
MSDTIRVRFAPSPTGPLHIGGVRTALYNFLFAKKHGGTFVLRIEDTDQNRFVEGAQSYIIEALNWCGIPYDEGPGKEGGYGPYKQSERGHLYKQYAEQLINEGKAYYAFDSAEDLVALRKQYETEGKTFIYNWHNRGQLDNSLSMSADELQSRLDRGEDHVIRFLSPESESLHLKDIVRGDMTIDTSTLDDKVLFKSDGMPTYHLANIVDDHLMEITHVIRGEEWLPSLALHQLLYNAFNWEAPLFAHLPLILKPTGKGKLSKRDGEKMGFPVFPLEWSDPQTKEVSKGFREEGYFPEAVINFLAFLGWNPGTEQELFNINELIDAFDLERVHKAGARFDPEKTNWYNHQYMQFQSNKELAKSFKTSRPELSDVDLTYIKMVVGLIKERATFVNEFWDLSHYFFQAPSSYDQKAVKKAVKDDTADLLEEVAQIIMHTREITVQNLESKVKSWITENNIGFGRVMMPLRLALVGALQGPDVFEIIFMIGKNESIRRIEAAINQEG